MPTLKALVGDQLKVWGMGRGWAVLAGLEKKNHKLEETLAQFIF